MEIHDSRYYTRSDTRFPRYMATLDELDAPYGWNGRTIVPGTLCYRIKDEWVPEKELESYLVKYHGPVMERGPGIMRGWKTDRIWCGELYRFIDSLPIRHRDVDRYARETWGMPVDPYKNE